MEKKIKIAYLVKSKLIEWRDAEFNHLCWSEGKRYASAYYDVLQPGNIIYPVKTKGTDKHIEGIELYHMQKEYYTVMLYPGEIKELIKDKLVKHTHIKRYQVFVWPDGAPEVLGTKLNVQFGLTNEIMINNYWFGEFNTISEVEKCVREHRDEFKEISFCDTIDGKGLFLNGFIYWDVHST